MKFGTKVRLKPSNDRGEFELDWARSKNYIAKNSFALGHETHNISAVLCYSPICLRNSEIVSSERVPLAEKENKKLSNTRNRHEK